MRGLDPRVAMNKTNDNDEHPARAFFGRRKGHPLRARQVALFDTLLPRIALDLTKPAPADLRALFDMPLDEVRLEIGFRRRRASDRAGASATRAAASSAATVSSTPSARRSPRSKTTRSAISACISATPAS